MMNTLILIAALFLVLVVVPYALWHRKKMRQQSSKEMEQRYGKENLLVLDEKVLYYGIQSRGTPQPIELGGVFAITNKLVHFKTWSYKGNYDFELVLPLDRLKGIRRSSKFVGLGPARRISGGLLILSYNDEKGNSEELALRLKKEEEAIHRLQEITGLKLEERDD